MSLDWLCSLKPLPDLIASPLLSAVSRGVGTSRAQWATTRRRTAPPQRCCLWTGWSSDEHEAAPCCGQKTGDLSRLPSLSLSLSLSLGKDTSVLNSWRAGAGSATPRPSSGACTPPGCARPRASPQPRPLPSLGPSTAATSFRDHPVRRRTAS